MGAVQEASANAVRDTLKRISQQKNKTTFKAEDFMDDGSKIQLQVDINPETGDAVFDFNGTSQQTFGKCPVFLNLSRHESRLTSWEGNWNATPAVTNSAMIYALRCLVAADIPLNQGCMLPIQLLIPEKSLLDPNEHAAVAAGNGLTAQRVVDTILKALEICAASNGCMANFTFGLPEADGFGYYETIAGGSGAGPGWIGEDGVHVHMTNTRITDAEILERRYPVLLREYSLRKGSGGAGQYRGGDGVVRELEFLIDLHIGVLSERRAFPPYGMAGGEAASTGLNLWLRGDGSVINVGGKASFQAKAGDRFRILTPGGGGYGPPSSVQLNGQNGERRGQVPMAFVPRAAGSVFARQSLQDTQ